MFNTVSIDLGDIKPESKHDLVFDYDQNVVMVTRITTPCDCTEAKNDFMTRAVKAVYTAPPFPVHLQREGHTSLEVSRVIEAYFNDPTGDELHQTLHFKATLKL